MHNPISTAVANLDSAPRDRTPFQDRTGMTHRYRLRVLYGLSTPRVEVGAQLPPLTCTEEVTRTAYFLITLAPLSAPRTASFDSFVAPPSSRSPSEF